MGAPPRTAGRRARPDRRGPAWTDLVGFLDDGRLAVFGAGTIELRTAPFAEPSARIPLDAGKVLGVWDASTPDRTRFLIRERGNRLRLVNPAGETLRLIPLELGFESLVCAVRPGRRSVAVCSNSRSVPQSKIRRIYDLETGSFRTPLGESGYEVYDLRFDSAVRGWPPPAETGPSGSGMRTRAARRR